MSDPGRLEVVHHFPGRLRVRARLFREKPERVAALCQLLEAEPGISSAAANPQTGSLLILYRPQELQLPRLIRKLIHEGGFDGVQTDSHVPELGPALGGTQVRSVAARVNEGLRQLTGGQVDLKVAVPGSLASLGLGMLLFGRRRTPEWYDLLFWSFVTFVNLNPPQGKAAGDGTAARIPE